MEKEVADVAAVAVDCIRLFFGHDAIHVMNKRLAENIPKAVENRSGEFYVEKTRKIKERIGDLCP